MTAPAMTSTGDRVADVKSWLITDGFAADAPDEEMRSIICSRAAEVVARLMPSGRPTISRTCVESIIGHLMVRVRMTQDFSLTVSAGTTAFSRALSTRAQTGI